MPALNSSLVHYPPRDARSKSLQEDLRLDHLGIDQGDAHVNSHVMQNSTCVDNSTSNP